MLNSSFASIYTFSEYTVFAEGPTVFGEEHQFPAGNLRLGLWLNGASGALTDLLFGCSFCNSGLVSDTD